MVRIHLPPAVSRTKLLGCIGYLSLAKSKAGASFGSNRPAKTVDDSGEGQVEPGLSTSAGRSSSSRGKPRRLHPSTGRFPRSPANATMWSAARYHQHLAGRAGNAAAQLMMPTAAAAPVSSGEPTAEATVKTVSEPTMKTVGEATVKTVGEATVKTVGEAAMKTMGEGALKTVAEAMVETRKSSRHHDSGPEPEKPRLGGPIRIIERIGVIVRIRIAIGIFGWRGNHINLRRQSRRSLGDPPAPIRLLAGFDDRLLLLSAYRDRNGVAGARRLVGRRLRGVGRGRGGLGGRWNNIRLGGQVGGVLHDMPATVRLSTRPGICLLRPSSDRYRRGEVAAVELRFILRQLRFAWHRCDLDRIGLGLASCARQDHREGRDRAHGSLRPIYGAASRRFRRTNTPYVREANRADRSS